MYLCMAAQCKSAAECASDVGAASESYSTEQQNSSDVPFVGMTAAGQGRSPLDSRQFPPQPSPGSKQERLRVVPLECRRKVCRTPSYSGTIRWSVARASIIAVRARRPACDMLGKPHPRLREGQPKYLVGALRRALRHRNAFFRVTAVVLASPHDSPRPRAYTDHDINPGLRPRQDDPMAE